MANCKPGCSCGDFGSRADQLPSLLDIGVVSSIIAQAIKNMFKRAHDVAQERMTTQELERADEKLVHWLTVTFCGDNPHYATAEDWNAQGLAAHMRALFDQKITFNGDDDEEVIATAAAIFLADAYEVLSEVAQRAPEPDAAVNTPEVSDFVERWSKLLTGAPLDMLS